MGVINFTPNSFSDPKKYFDKKKLIETIGPFKNKSDLIFDFGFESTAPMNQAITKKLERARFDEFFDHLKDVDLSGSWISFDTYRPENFRYFEECFNARYRDCGFIFNDVSGVIDLELTKLLSEKKKQENFYYLYAASHIPSRDKVLEHMNFLVEGDIVQMTRASLQNALDKLHSMGLKNIILDPCFGFSKTYDQNWDLINRFFELKDFFDNDIPWLIGLSKKSFLRKALPQSLDLLSDSEILHEKIMRDMIQKNSGHLIFRVHDPDIVERANARL
ncbi:MAG: dihydropteroate synthase [Bacteriovorax sp.]